jgi:formate dehydrogenase iron-sulfur subunit
VQPEDVSSLFDSDFLNAGAHKLSLGLTDEIAWFAGQDRVTYKRVGLIDPLSLNDYEAHGGLVGLRKAVTQSGSDIVAEVTASGLRGRGGAGFPAGIKWKTVLDAQADQKYVCCNADEGDSGTFADRILIEADPFTLIEGMAIAAVAVGATQGFVYLRSEYPTAITRLRDAIAIAETAGVLGSSVLGSKHAFNLEVRVGAGSYVCGEETAMLESLEGKRGVVRSKPPLPAIAGLFGKPKLLTMF